jgi:hypothetical protein
VDSFGAMDIEVLARGLAVNRALFGAGYMAAPERAVRGWVGRSLSAPSLAFGLVMAGASTAIAGAYAATRA